MPEPGVSAATGTIDVMLRETLRLAEDVRAYILRRPGADATALMRLEESAEIGRITAQIGHASAWLLARQAVRRGELTAAEAREPAWRLEGGPLCDDDAPFAPGRDLPLELERLARRSHGLYARVRRLDEALEAESEAV